MSGSGEFRDEDKTENAEGWLGLGQESTFWVLDFYADHIFLLSSCSTSPCRWLVLSRYYRIVTIVLAILWNLAKCLFNSFWLHCFQRVEFVLSISKLDGIQWPFHISFLSYTSSILPVVTDTSYEKSKCSNKVISNSSQETSAIQSTVSSDNLLVQPFWTLPSWACVKVGTFEMVWLLWGVLLCQSWERRALFYGTVRLAIYCSHKLFHLQ